MSDPRHPPHPSDPPDQTDQPGLLDRRAEQTRLLGVLDRARGGRGSVAVVVGEAGIGKTSLLRQVSTAAADAGWLELTGRGSPLEGQYAFGVVRQLLAGRPGADGTGLTPAGLDDDAADQLLAPHRRPPGTPEVAEEELLHALYWWFVGLADDGPVLVRVDDLHWCDPPSMRTLAFLALRLERHRIALVLGTRPPTDEPGRAMLDGLRAAGAEVVRPTSLTRASVASLVRTRLGEPDPTFVDACLATTSGNPMLLTELVQALGERSVRPTGEARALVEDIGPDAVRAHVAALLAGQPPGVRRLAESIAVAGPRLPAELALAVAGLTDDEGEPAVAALVDLQLIEGGDGLTYRHPLLAGTVYRSLTPDVRDRLHRRAAELLLERSRPCEQVAAHLLQVTPRGDPSRVAVLAEAALEARRRGALGSSAVYLRRALDEPPPAPARAEVARQLGTCEAYLQDWEGAERHLEEAVRAAHDDRGRALAAYSLARFLEVTRRTDQGAQVLAEAVRRLPPGAEPGLRARMLAELAGYGAEVVRRVDESVRAVEELDRVPSDVWPPAPHVVLAHRALTAARGGAPAAEVVELASAALAGDLLAPDLSGLYTAVFALAGAGAHTESEAPLRRAAEWARRRGLAAPESLGRSYLATIAVWRGDLVEAQAQLDRGWAASSGGRDHAAAPLLGCQLEVHVERGRLAEAAELLAQVPLPADVAATSGGLRGLIGRARYHLAADDPAEALADLDLVGRLHSAWRAESLLTFPWRSLRAGALARLGRADEAVAAAEEELALARAFGAPRPLGTALLALAELDRPRVEVLAGEAADVLSRGDHRIARARARAVLGRCALARGDSAAGRRLLRQASQDATDAGADALQAEVARDLTKAGGRPPRPATRGVKALTPTEHRVAELLSQDLTNRQVARTLYVTEKTVEYHVTNILRKLGARSRHDLGRALASG